MVGVLVHTHPVIINPLLTPPGADLSGLCPDQTPQPPWGGACPLPLSQTGNISRSPHFPLRDRPLHPQYRLPHKAQHLLVQGAKMGHKLLLLDTLMHPGHRVLPVPRPPPGVATTETSRPSDTLLPA